MSRRAVKQCYQTDQLRAELQGNKVQMTYCVGILVREGLVMIADTRTNAGLDDVSTFRKLRTYQTEGERVVCITTAGSLSFTQLVMGHLGEGIRDQETGRTERLETTHSMFQAVQLVGDAVRLVRETYGRSMRDAGVSFGASFLIGGQHKDQDLRLFLVYSAGNPIECTPDTPFLQIGEHKYGKPILDRAVTFETDVYDALKIGLISMDSTMRSNIAVGLPIDVTLVRRGALEAELIHRIEPGEAYYHDLRERWSAALRRAYRDIPAPPYRSTSDENRELVHNQ